MLPADFRQPGGEAREKSFSHISRDVYTKTGIHSAAERIKSVIGSFESVGCLGFHTYNEGFGDHFNAYAKCFPIGTNGIYSCSSKIKDIPYAVLT